MLRRCLSRMSVFWLCVFALLSCSRKPKEKLPSVFEIRSPLAEEYGLLIRTVKKHIQKHFPEAQINAVDELPSRYSIILGDEWLKKASASGPWELYLTAESPLQINEAIAQIKLIDSPYVVKSLLKASNFESLVRDSSYFCQISPAQNDQLEYSACAELMNSLCVKNRSKRKSVNFKCALREAPPKAAEKHPANERELIVARLPLPIRVNSDYPLTRPEDLDPEMWVSLFGLENEEMNP